MPQTSSLTIEENVPLAPLTTFGVGGSARFFVRARHPDQVPEAVRWAAERALPLFVLAGGSNLLVPDEGFAGLVLQMATEDVSATSGGVFHVTAGVNWDNFVNATLNANCAGVECLAGIPGSVGGTPVQNVGAYGQEVSETIVGVKAYDRHENRLIELDREACRFRYRGSLFNTDEPGRYIVMLVRFQLRPGGSPTLRYAELARSFADASHTPTLREVADRVRDIRRNKGMLLVQGDPDSRSAGSFFKNPIVAERQVVAIGEAAGVAASEVPQWDAGDGCKKISAAWLLEHAGFVKGYGTGPVRISSRHTLALTNRGGATFADIQALEAEIVTGVRERFGVTLHREPVVLGQGSSMNSRMGRCCEQTADFRRE